MKEFITLSALALFAGTSVVGTVGAGLNHITSNMFQLEQTDTHPGAKFVDASTGLVVNR